MAGEFDTGLIKSIAKRFSPAGHSAAVAHDETLPCRRKGGACCTYTVTWLEAKAA